MAPHLERPLRRFRPVAIAKRLASIRSKAISITRPGSARKPKLDIAGRHPRRVGLTRSAAHRDGECASLPWCERVAQHGYLSRQRKRRSLAHRRSSRRGPGRASLFDSNQLVVLSDFSQDCSLLRGAKRHIHVESCVKADKTSYRTSGFGRVQGNRRQCYVIWTPDRQSSSSACS